MTAEKQNLTVTLQFMRAQTIHASIVVIETPAFCLAY